MSDPAFERALADALERLRSSDRFEAEIAARLVAKGHDAHTIERVLGHLRSKGIVNDRRLAMQAIERNVGKSALGAERLRARLEAKGAPPELLNDLLGGVDELPGALELLQAKFKPTDPIPRAARFLASRGFEEDAIRSAIESHFQREMD